MDARRAARWALDQICDPYVGLALIAAAVIACAAAPRPDPDDAIEHGLTREHRRQCQDCRAAFARGAGPR